jgi:hypothetical protein
MTLNRSSFVVRLCAALILLTSALVPTFTRAANIVWGSPQQITGDTDVSTQGTLIGAFNVGDTGVPSTTVNGVTFQSFAAPGGNGSSGNFTMTAGGGGVFNSNTDGGSTMPPFSNLSAGYQTLLSSYVTPLFSPVSLTISGLVVGKLYEFQFWSNLSSQMFGYQITATGGNSSVTLSSNTGGAEGGLGQFVKGTFTADATTQVISFLGDGDGGFLNGFALRQIPEPNTTALLIVGLVGAGLFHLRRRVKAATR